MGGYKSKRGRLTTSEAVFYFYKIIDNNIIFMLVMLRSKNCSD